MFREGTATILPEATDRCRVDSARVIVEGRIAFDYEITLLTVRSLDLDGSIRTDVCAPIGHRQVQGDYVESWQPQPMSPAALTAALFALGAILLSYLVDYTITLFRSIPHLIG